MKKLILAAGVAALLILGITLSSKEADKRIKTPEYYDKKVYIDNVADFYKQKLEIINNDTDVFITTIINTKETYEEKQKFTDKLVSDIIKNTNEIIHYANQYMPKLQTDMYKIAFQSLINFNTERIKMIEAIYKEFQKQKSITEKKAFDILEEHYKNIAPSDVEAVNFLNNLHDHDH